MKVVEVRNGFNDFHFYMCLLIFERSDRYSLNTGPLKHIPGTDKSNPKDTKHNESNPAPGCGKPSVSTPKQQRRYSPKR